MNIRCVPLSNLLSYLDKNSDRKNNPLSTLQFNVDNRLFDPPFELIMFLAHIHVLYLSDLKF